MKRTSSLASNQKFRVRFLVGLLGSLKWEVGSLKWEVGSLKTDREPISHFTLLTSNFQRLVGVLDSMTVFETVGPGSIPGRVIQGRATQLLSATYLLGHTVIPDKIKMPRRRQERATIWFLRSPLGMNAQNFHI